MPREVYGHFSLAAGQSWYYWFETPPGDTRVRYLIAKGLHTQGVFTSEYWVASVFKFGETQPRTSYRILVENRGPSTQQFMIYVYVFPD